MRLRCDACGEWIPESEGLIAIYSSEGGYPEEPSADLNAALEAELMERRRESGSSLPSGWTTMDELVEAGIAAEQANPPNIVFEIAHDECLQGGEDGYWIHLNRCPDALRFLGWLEHLMTKAWFGQRDLRVLLERILEDNPEARHT